MADKPYLVTLDKDGCIGAGVCEAFSEAHWKVGDDRKASLIGSTQNEKNGLWELYVGEEDLNILKQAADGCPVRVIHIIDTRTGEKVI